MTSEVLWWDSGSVDIDAASGAFVFADFYYKLLLMSIIAVYANLFSLEIKCGPLALLHMPLPPRRGTGQ